MCCCACASHWRQPSLFGDDTHAVATRPKWALEHATLFVWFLMSVGCELGPSKGDRNKDAGLSERKGKKEGKKERITERQNDRTNEWMKERKRERKIGKNLKIAKTHSRCDMERYITRPFTF